MRQEAVKVDLLDLITSAGQAATYLLLKGIRISWLISPCAVQCIVRHGRMRVAERPEAANHTHLPNGRSSITFGRWHHLNVSPADEGLNSSTSAQCAALEVGVSP